MKTIEDTVQSLDDLVTLINSIFSKTGRRWWFRGHPGANWTLLPKIRRGFDATRERVLTNLFYQRAKLRHASFPGDDDYASWLALMQHYGLPTRLLDWSESVLIAVYFATKFEWDEFSTTQQGDAAIWMLQPETLNEKQGYGPYFPSLNSTKISRLIDEAFKKLGANDRRGKYEVIAAVPTNQDMRMVMQQGAFTVHADSVPLEARAGCKEWLRKIVIPAKVIPGMRKALDILGVRLSDVFPDLNHLATDLARMQPGSPAAMRRSTTKSRR